MVELKEILIRSMEDNLKLTMQFYIFYIDF